MENTKIDFWAIVELFGHSKVAGKCTEQSVAGTNMLRVDVPESKDQPAFTKYYGGAAIYAINPVDETTAKLAAESLSVAPINVWQGSTFTEKFLANKPALAAASDSDEDEDLGDEFENDHPFFPEL